MSAIDKKLDEPTQGEILPAPLRAGAPMPEYPNNWIELSHDLHNVKEALKRLHNFAVEISGNKTLGVDDAAKYRAMALVEDLTYYSSFVLPDLSKIVENILEQLRYADGCFRRDTIRFRADIGIENVEIEAPLSTIEGAVTQYGECIEGLLRQAIDAATARSVISQKARDIQPKDAEDASSVG